MSKNSHPTHSRPEIVKATIVFQVKLIADAVRDLLMSPVGLVAGIIDFLAPEQQRSNLDKLMKFGRHTDRLINLFNHESSENRDPNGIDGLADQFEDYIRKAYHGSEKGKQLSRTMQDVVDRVKESNSGGEPR